MSADYFVITGASGGGKSTLIEELQFLGHSVVPEVGRAIVREQLSSAGHALPWVNLPAFIDAVLARTVCDHAAAASLKSPIFFDRAIPEVLGWARAKGLSVKPDYLRAVERCRYNRLVFVIEPWPEIYTVDGERRGDLETAVHWFEPTVAGYRDAGYDLCVVPRGTVRERAQFILDRLHCRDQ